MIIRKVAVGNSEEAFIEDTLSEGLNILLSDDNDKGKTIIIQSMLYALGNKPIFPNSFNYKDFVYYLEFEHNSEIYIIVRSGDEYVLKYSDKLGIFEGMSELKRFWNNNIFQLPMIPFQGEKELLIWNCLFNYSLWVKIAKIHRLFLIVDSTIKMTLEICCSHIPVIFHQRSRLKK